MIFGFLGSIPLGADPLTGPTEISEKLEPDFVQHSVARGKPPVQDVGDKLDTKEMKFFFDETWCDPMAELAKLDIARDTREPLAYVSGAGAYSGTRYVINSFQVKTLKATPRGTPVRLEISISLLEIPIPNPLSWLGSVARGIAVALTPWGADNPSVRK